MSRRDRAAMSNRPEPDDDGRALARHHVAAAIEVEVALMNDPTASATARLAAAEAILNRACGRPPSAPNPMTPTDDFDRVLAAAEAIVAAERRPVAGARPVADGTAAVRY
jgi:hypothetical protein